MGLPLLPALGRRDANFEAGRLTMNSLIALLFSFIVLGLARQRLGRFAYVAMGAFTVLYVSYAYYSL